MNKSRFREISFKVFMKYRNLDVMFIFEKFDLFLEPLRCHLAKIAHDVAKSKYFSNI